MASECGVARGTVARIENDRPFVTPQVALVRMARADQVPGAAGDRLAQSLRIVAVQKGDLPAAERQLPEQAVIGLAGRGDRGLDFLFPLIDVAEHEVGRPGSKQGNDLRRADITAMQHRGGENPSSMRTASRV